MTKVNRNVILDLLPLYVGGETSEDTAALVEDYLKSDPKLAELAYQMTQAHAQREIPQPRSKEAEMSNFEKYKQMLIIRSTIVITLVAMLLFAAMVFIPLVLWFFKQ